LIRIGGGDSSNFKSMEIGTSGDRVYFIEYIAKEEKMERDIFSLIIYICTLDMTQEIHYT